MIEDTLYFSDRAIVHAIDARTGKWRWTYDPSRAKLPESPLASIPTVALPTTTVYVGTPDGRLVALDASGVGHMGHKVVRWGAKAINGAQRR